MILILFTRINKNKYISLPVKDFLILLIIFFGIFTPIAFIMRFSGSDELRLQFKKKNTHWINRKTLDRIDTFKKQF